MYDDFAPSALTEVSLALAMGIFSVLVLSLIGMGSGHNPENSDESARTIVAIAIESSTESTQEASTELNDEDLFLVYFNGGLVDARLQSVSDNVIGAATRVILGVDPRLTTQEVTTIRATIKNPSVLATPLTEDWLSALEEKTEYGM